MSLARMYLCGLRLVETRPGWQLSGLELSRQDEGYLAVFQAPNGVEISYLSREGYRDALERVVARMTPSEFEYLQRYEEFTCSPKTPCCDRRDEYNGFKSGTRLFDCPKNCACHD